MKSMITVPFMLAFFSILLNVFTSRVIAVAPTGEEVQSCRDSTITQQGTYYLYTLSHSKTPERKQAAITYLRLVQRMFAASPLEKKQRIADILNDIIVYTDSENNALELGCTENGKHIDDEEIIGGRAIVTGRVVVETVPERFCYPECESMMVESVNLVDLERPNTDRPTWLGLGCKEGEAIIGTLVNDLTMPYDETDRPIREVSLPLSEEVTSYKIFITPHRRIATEAHPCATQILSIEKI